MRFRVVAVFCGLMVAGAAVGAACAVVLLELALALERPFEGPIVVDVSALTAGAAVLGALVGAIFAPLGSFVLLRRVPLGSAAVACGLGTLLGGIVGHRVWGFNPYDADLTPGIVRGAMLGYVLTSIAMRSYYRWKAGRGPR